MRYRQCLAIFNPKMPGSDYRIQNFNESQSIKIMKIRLISKHNKLHIHNYNTINKTKGSIIIKN